MPRSTPLTTEGRRQFIKTTAAAAGAAAVLRAPLVHSQGLTDDVIRIGVIGCGGRGSGAVLDALGAATNIVYPQLGFHTETVTDDAKVANKNVEVIALADMFSDRIESCARDLEKLGINIPESRRFTGFDAYKQLLEIPEINYVIQATPPRFRPGHVLAAVEAGKNVFMEKPAAVDAPGVKTIMQAGELAEAKGLGIVAGTKRRHTQSYLDTVARIHNGEIGDIVYAKAYWNGGEIWVIPREVGAVRDHSRGHAIRHLEYEAYPGMAEREMEKICDEAAERWPGVRVAIAHRTGHLEIGDLAVVVAAAAPHRGEAFEAARFTIDTLKERVPIWKKEVATDGEYWVEDHA